MTRVAAERYGGAIATCGMTGGIELGTSVIPFIVRGVSLLGIDSVMCPADVRAALWLRLSTDLKPKYLTEAISREVALEDVQQVALGLLGGAVRGRTIVGL